MKFDLDKHLGDAITVWMANSVRFVGKLVAMNEEGTSIVVDCTDETKNLLGGSRVFVSVDHIAYLIYEKRVEWGV